MSKPALAVARPAAPARDPLAQISKSYIRHRRAANFSPNTIESYEEALSQLRRFVRDQHLPKDPPRIRREHSLAHSFLSNGGEGSDLTRIAGWRSRAMILRDAASTGTQRAIEVYRRLSPMDRLS
jgi:hypothetical protein